MLAITGLLLLSSLQATQVSAHIAAWAKGMYCFGGTSGSDNPNTNEAVQPLYQLAYQDWWMHHSNNCDQFPPAPGQILNLPAGGSFQVEMAGNRGQTSFSFNGAYTSAWPDGGQHPSNLSAYPNCINSPLIHTYNQSDVAGSAFAISYTSDIKKVTLSNLAVFSVRYGTPWQRIASFDVPKAMPACPPGGCICTWNWVPNHCGQPNMYMIPYRCNVTNVWSGSTAPVATAKPPVWCENNSAGCLKGSKQIVVLNQLAGNNVNVTGYQADGQTKSPGYNSKCGFADGAQNDIFSS